MLVYIPGYVVYRFKHKYIWAIVEKHSIWLAYVSRGSLSYPNDYLMEAAKALNVEFHKMHGNFISIEKKIFTNLDSKALAYIRLRELNRKISFDKCKRSLATKYQNLQIHRNKH